MKIATWNVERPSNSTKKRNQNILDVLRKIDADILILTETNSVINPGGDYTVAAAIGLPINQIFDAVFYKPGESRTTIWSKFPIKRQFKTFNNYTSVCAEIETPQGNLIVYGTIIGIRGNRDKSFKTDLDLQLEDWKKLCKQGPMCVVGDFNISFYDNYYFTIEGRQKLNTFFSEFSITNLTENIPQNIDHIAISGTFPKNRKVEITTWNEDKKLSDHIGVCVTFSK